MKFYNSCAVMALAILGGLLGIRDAQARLSVGGGAGTGLKGDYFANKTLTGPVTLTRTDSMVNFNWGSGAPAGSLPGNLFSVRWTGQVQAPVSGSYTFYTTSDDGARLWVNGQRIINNWTDHAPTTNTSIPVMLAAGQKVDIKLEYYENGAGAVAKLLWSYPGQAQQVIPQSRLYPAGTSTDTPPTVSLTIPAADAVFTAPASVSLAASASDADGMISKVEFFQGSRKLGEDTADPYTFSWTSVPAGAYTLTARATDNTGAGTTSAPVSITVNNAPSGGGDGTIYADSLQNEWQDWGWATRGYNNPSPTRSGGASIRVTPGAWEALYLHHAPFDAGAYTSLTFWIHGGAAGGQRLQVQAMLGGAPQPPVTLAPLAANTWRQVTLSLSSLGVAGASNLDGFWIQDASGGAQPTFYVDDIRFEPASPVPTPTPTPAPTPAPTPGIPVPAGLAVFADDHNAVLSWDGGVLRQGETLPAPQRSFRVVWGRTGQPMNSYKLVTDRIAQIQPLENGVSYTAQVQALDDYGRASAFSAPINFTPNDARTRALAAQMTGFFDDFNRPAGAIDERKWNTSYSTHNAPDKNGTFINDQFHVHNTLSNYFGPGMTGGDGEWVMNRPRAVFDVTGRTGTVAFDFDGTFHERDVWYLDMIPADVNGGRLDAIGHVSAGPIRQHPGDFIRFEETGQILRIYYHDAAGQPHLLAITDWGQYRPLDHTPVKLVPNVRRRMKIMFSQTHAEWFIDDLKVLEADYNLSYTRVVPTWLIVSYNTAKQNKEVALFHWDNFGFDGPAPATRTHNYKVALDNSEMMRLTPGNATYTLKIPDSLAGATARRMMFVRQNTGPYGSIWSPNDKVTINGTDVRIPPASSATGLTDHQLTNDTTPFAHVLDIPEGVFITGDNIITVSMQSGGVSNVHAEFDFPAGSAPAYTQPLAVLYPRCAAGLCPPGEVMPGMPAMPLPCPSVGIVRVGESGNLWLSRDNINGLEFGVRGTVPVEVQADCFTSLLVTGGMFGVERVELLVDGVVALSQRVDAGFPAAYSKIVFNLDTTKLANGVHRLLPRAYGPNGVPARLRYDGALFYPQTDFSLRINVAN